MSDKKSDVSNKSQAIKDLLKENPKLMPLEISNILKERGIEVTRGYASVVKSNLKKPATSKKAFTAKKKRITSNKPVKSGLDIGLLIDVKKICDKYGTESVQGAIEALSHLS